MMSLSSFGVKTSFVVRHALATKLDETSTARAMAVPHVQTLDMVEMVSLVNRSAIMVVMPTASPVHPGRHCVLTLLITKSSRFIWSGKGVKNVAR